MRGISAVIGAPAVTGASSPTDLSAMTGVPAKSKNEQRNARRAFIPNLPRVYCEFVDAAPVGQPYFAVRDQFPASLFLRAASNSSPGCQPATPACEAALLPSAKPNRAIFASPLKSHSGRYSSLG